MNIAPLVVCQLILQNNATQLFLIIKPPCSADVAQIQRNSSHLITVDDSIDTVLEALCSFRFVSVSKVLHIQPVNAHNTAATVIKLIYDSEPAGTIYHNIKTIHHLSWGLLNLRYLPDNETSRVAI